MSLLKRIRMIAGFAAAVVILQGLALLLLTPAGIEKMYPFAVRLFSEKITPDSNTYAVYYDTRAAVSDADLVVVGVDGNVAESYDLLGHFTRFLKQYNNFSHVLIDFDRASEKLASGMINETRESLFYSRLRALKNQYGLSDDYCDYLSELFIINSTMAPVRKFDIDSYSSEDNAGTEPLAARIADSFGRADRTALCIVDSQELLPASTFRKELETLLGDKNVVYINTYYTENSPSSESHGIIGFPLKGSEAGVYFADNSKFEPFYEYYRSVSNVFGKDGDIEDPLDERYTRYYFIVSNGSDPGHSAAEEERETEAETMEETE